MRDFIDAILTFIGTATLTDVEFDGLTIETYGYDEETYLAIDAVLQSRDGVSTFRDRLSAYFQAKGVTISTPEPTAKSSIFVGGDLS